MAVAVVKASSVGPLAWEPPYAMGAALKKKGRKKKERERETSAKGRKLLGKTAQTFSFEGVKRRSCTYHMT